MKTEHIVQHYIAYFMVLFIYVYEMCMYLKEPFKLSVPIIGREEEDGLWTGQTHIWILAPTFPSCVTVYKLQPLWAPVSWSLSLASQGCCITWNDVGNAGHTAGKQSAVKMASLAEKRGRRKSDRAPG